jgi:hypothetical protein
MLKPAPIIAYTLVVLVISAGCSDKNKKEPPPAEIKLGDLAPINPVGPLSSIQTAAFDFYSIELPAENIDRLSDVWPMLYTKHVRLADPAAFAANSFRLVFGEYQMWQKTAALLESAGAEPGRKVTLLLDYGQVDDFAVKRISEKTNVSCSTANGTIESLVAQPGRLALKVKVLPVAGARGICDFEAIPAFIPMRPLASDANATPIEETTLESLGFVAQMTPGDFLLLGPASRPDRTNSVGSLFFTAPKKPRIRLYAIFCSGITD